MASLGHSELIHQGLTRHDTDNQIINLIWQLDLGSHQPGSSLWHQQHDIWHQAGKLKIFGTRPNRVVSYTYPIENSTRPGLFSIHPVKFSLALASGWALVSQPVTLINISPIALSFLPSIVNSLMPDHRVPTHSLFLGKVLSFHHGSSGPCKVLIFRIFFSEKSSHFSNLCRLVNWCLMSFIYFF